MSAAIYPITEEAIEWLSSRDQELGAVMRRMDPPKRRLYPDLFSGLVFYVISQQVSAKAAATEWERLQAICGPITPERIVQMAPEEIQRCGTTLRRSDYILAIARDVASGNIDLEELAVLPDDEFTRQIVRLPGIGEWAAQTLLIHVLCRPDIISFKDMAILRGMRMVYQVPKIGRPEFERYRELYSPYATTASIYLWAISAGAAGSLPDPARTGR